MNGLGRHILAEFTGCKSAYLEETSLVERVMVEAAELAGATVVQSVFHQFSPYGVSGVVVIQESHFAIHTWPEHDFVAVDLFTCGSSLDPWKAFEHLKQAFNAKDYSTLELERGSKHGLQGQKVAGV